MMKYKLTVAVCYTLILCALTGCQLAQENAGTDAYEDRLIGIFITTEYLDLFDFESYLGDNLSSLKGGEINMDGNAQKYQGRLYAELTTKTLTNEETGETSETDDYVFPVEGMSYFVATVPAMEGRDSYISCIGDPAISDGHTSLSYGDDGNNTKLEGTIYVTPSNMKHTYYFNSVYQSADGSIYATSGSGFMVNSEAYSEGSAYSQTLDATTTVTENGKAKIDSISITLSISVMFAPEKIAVLQMDADSKLLSRTEYPPDALPEVIEPEAGTDYLIVETHKRDDTGNLIIAREIYSRDAENISTFFVREDGICVEQWTQIGWPK